MHPINCSLVWAYHFCPLLCSSRLCIVTTVVLVFAGVILPCCVQGDESVTVSVQPDSTDGLYMAKQPAYTDYIPLWTNLMDPSKIKAGVHCIYSTIHIHMYTYTHTCPYTNTLTTHLHICLVQKYFGFHLGMGREKLSLWKTTCSYHFHLNFSHCYTYQEVQ